MKISLNVCRKKNCTYVNHLILHECNYEDVYYSILFIGISCITQWYMHVFSISDNLTSQPLGTLEDSRKLTTCTTHFTQYFLHTYYTLIHTHKHTHTHHGLFTGVCRVPGHCVCTPGQGCGRGEPDNHWRSPSASAGASPDHVTRLLGYLRSSLWFFQQSGDPDHLPVFALLLLSSETKVVSFLILGIHGITDINHLNFRIPSKISKTMYLTKNTYGYH